MITFVKQPDKAFDLVEDANTLGVLRLQKDRKNKPEEVAKPQSAKGNKDAIPIPKTSGQPDPKVASLIPDMEKCFILTQYCLFEVRGKTIIAAINVHPSQSGKAKGAKITATTAPIKDGYAGKETTKSFRGMPKGVERAFAWIAERAKGGYLWTNRFEVELDFCGGRRRVSNSKALKASIAAWKEGLGIED